MSPGPRAMTPSAPPLGVPAWMFITSQMLYLLDQLTVCLFFGALQMNSLYISTNMGLREISTEVDSISCVNIAIRIIVISNSFVSD